MLGFDRSLMVQPLGLRTSDAANDADDYAPGELVDGKYRLLRFLGEGSQGSVWLAENTALSAEVAVKIVHAEASNPAATLRLEKEARVAARLGHAGVVRVFDLGRTERGDAFIVMEFLRGETLGDRLTTSGRLAPIEAVRTLLPIADVLHVAHEAGIVHRDLKPENVFLANAGSVVQPKLLDFGIAKKRPKTGAAEPVITDVGAIVGSPAYLSPEQASCREDIGQAADIWSFCVVLYECLTGVLPFAGETYRELFRQIEEDAPQPTLIHGVADVELWAIIRRGLAKSAAQRWPDMQSLGRALACWLKSRGVDDDISGLRLDSRWLSRGHGERVRTPNSDELSSSVRPVDVARNEALRRPLKRSRVRLSAALLTFGVVLAVVTPFAIGQALSTMEGGAEPTRARSVPAGVAAAVEASPVVVARPAPPVLTDVVTKAAPAAAPVWPRTSVSNLPHASQPATTKAVRRALRAAPSPLPPAGTDAARRRSDRPRTDDLIEPY
jgi:serine/threonine protein kinase